MQRTIGWTVIVVVCHFSDCIGQNVKEKKIIVKYLEWPTVVGTQFCYQFRLHSNRQKKCQISIFGRCSNVIRFDSSRNLVLYVFYNERESAFHGRTYNMQREAKRNKKTKWSNLLNLLTSTRMSNTSKKKKIVRKSKQILLVFSPHSLFWF